MTRTQIKAMVLDIIATADYDLYKSYLPECAEEPEYSAERLEELIVVAEKHLKIKKKKY